MLEIMLSLIVVVSSSAAYFVWFWRKKLSFWRERGINGPPAIPIFGNSLSLMFNSIADIDIKNRNKYGRMYGTYEGSDPILVISDPHLITEIYQSKFSDFADQFHPNKSSHDHFDMMNLVVLSGNKWKTIRKIFNSSMTSKNKIRQMFENLSLDSLFKFMDQNAGQKVDVSKLFSTFVTSASAQVMTGMDLDLFHHEDRNEILEAVDDVFTSLSLYNISYCEYWFIERLPHFMNKILGLTSHNKRCTDYYRNLVTQFARNRQESKVERQDLMQSLLDAMESGILTEDEVVANIMVAGIAASGPIVVSMTCFVYELTRNSLWQRKIQEEIGNNIKDSNHKVSFDAIQNNYPILEASLKESMRMHPTEARSFRRVSSKHGANIPGTDIHLPYGTGVQTAHYALHYDPEYWDRPETFEPGRFLVKDKTAGNNSTSFMSFGSGPRMCPGYFFAEILIKITLIEIMRRYNFVQVSGGNLCFPKNSMILLTDGIEVVFERRE